PSRRSTCCSSRSDRGRRSLLAPGKPGARRGGRRHWFCSTRRRCRFPRPAPRGDLAMQRRDFLKTAAAARVPAVAPGLLPGLAADEKADPAAKLERPDETVQGDMRYRALGRTGEKVSLIGLGGHHIGRQNEEAESIKIIRAAVDA